MQDWKMWDQFHVVNWIEKKRKNLQSVGYMWTALIFRIDLILKFYLWNVFSRSCYECYVAAGGSCRLSVIPVFSEIVPAEFVEVVVYVVFLKQHNEPSGA